ncbi:tripartite tricarboxylate transporter family receptor [Bordetella bronchiseptica MBORD678]|nr:tripartite tricarboxylate transporter family receptor [Bordetella bronchiseptica CARE970018BB]KDC59181.1 tripartite tricarboxylate transporter family receptor [Bordetella bronchiseptica MBORD595]KDC82487.1 tripartite tricarboxylate transporter family receptor [Bordetella bronchiseptica MBORD665]KDC85717.1 tripartite tricarboxylate transporter family receptor [Bordetella bronchiseptica MBORD668]KDC93758.1 tripartite tricarboxylate transporter family receptor [Bordetella bronchiseptica MBORD67
MERRRLLLGGLAAGIAAPLLARRAMASPRKYPGKPIRMIIPFPAAGVTDISARLLAAAMAEELGQTIIPENKPGAAGNIAAKYVADAAPDGYTILFNNSATHGINPTLFKSINFDAERDFTPILYCSSSPNLFVANKNFPGDTIADFVDIARQQGPAVMMALGSLGSSQHMAAELLRHVTATQFTTVPYRGGALALQDLIGGTVQTLCDGYPSSIQHIRRGTIKALGVTSPERIPSAPDIPAVAETLPGYSAYGWFGLVGPAGMDADVVAVLNQAGNKALQDPELRSRYAEVGATLHGGPPEVFKQHIQDEIKRWREIIIATNAKPE